jgi:hypothetical protein
MNAKLIEEIANAVLYEGYMLYPYRPSAVKNRQRWNFGVVYPKNYSELQNGLDPYVTQTECLVLGSSKTEIRIKARFLQAISRVIGELDAPVSQVPEKTELNFRPVATLQVGEQLLQTWQEACEREVTVTPGYMDALVAGPVTRLFRLPSRSEFEPVRNSQGKVAALILRTQEPIVTQVELAAVPVKEGVYKVTLTVANQTLMNNANQVNRDSVLLQSLLSAHSILSVDHGEFASLLDTPPELREFAAECRNVGTWPVLVGEDGKRDAMLSSPIILYDYPQIAPESAGNLFDGTEIDEILALRILTLTAEEKREMRQGDERARQILERTESLPAEQFLKLHGTLRGLRPTSEDRQ